MSDPLFGEAAFCFLDLKSGIAQLPTKSNEDGLVTTEDRQLFLNEILNHVTTLSQIITSTIERDSIKLGCLTTLTACDPSLNKTAEQVRKYIDGLIDQRNTLNQSIEKIHFASAKRSGIIKHPYFLDALPKATAAQTNAGAHFSEIGKLDKPVLAWLNSTDFGLSADSVKQLKMCIKENTFNKLLASNLMMAYSLKHYPWKKESKLHYSGYGKDFEAAFDKNLKKVMNSDTGKQQTIQKTRNGIRTGKTKFLPELSPNSATRSHFVSIASKSIDPNPTEDQTINSRVHTLNNDVVTHIAAMRAELTAEN